ncbi:MAG: ComF family protein [Selenomonadaceae bacterium]|nr:ComF family protein [Selenomonadaceae bacterium]
MNFLKELFEAVTYFLFPPRCPNCREIVDERYQLCEKCAGKILRLDFYDKPPFPISRVLRVTRYRDGLQPLLHKLKFDNNLNVLPALKKILDDVSNRKEMLKLLDGVDFVVPVPLHAERLKERGFNQTELIFEEFLAKKNIPLKKILIRRVATPKLYKYGKEDRQKILKGVFAAIELVDLRGKKILIVDDIFTTGTTVSECAKVLIELGAEKVSVLALASDFGENFH